jgi:hypothetical protein
MVNHSTHKAARVADIIQTVDKLLVLLVIVPAAVLLAVFFVTQPFISDLLVRQLFSLAVATCLAGAIATKTDRNLLGYALVLIGTILGAASLSSYWNRPFMSMGAIHASFLITLSLALDASSKKVLKERRAKLVIASFVILVMITGPMIGALYMLEVGAAYQQVILAALLISLPYTFGLHFYRRSPTLGIVEAFLSSASLSLVSAPIVYSELLLVGVLLLVSAHVLTFGLGLFLFTQLIRYIQTLVLKRKKRTAELVSERRRVEGLMGIDAYTEDEAVSQPESEPVPKLPSLIDPYIAQGISGLALMLIASGIPGVLLELAALTSFAESSWFLFLFAPLAAIVALVVVIPAAIFLRLGHYITRSREEQITKLLGLVTVLCGTAASYIWSQFSLWPVEYSALLAGVVTLSGVTGIFREVRRLWKRLWLRIVSGFRNLKRWIQRHPVHTGGAINVLLTLAILSIVSPLMTGFEYYELALIPLSVSIGSGFALVGLGALKRVKQRLQLAAVAWIVFLAANSLFTVWYLAVVLSTDAVHSISVSLIWMLGSAALQRLEVSRKQVGATYAPGVLGVLSYLWRIEPLYLPTRFVLPAVAAIMLPAALLHEEYRRALMRAGTAVYRGMTAFGALLLRFILISYAALAIVIIAYGSYSLLYASMGMELTYVLVVAGLLFFGSYSPVVKYRGMHHSVLVSSVIAGLAVFMGGFVYHLALGFVPQLQSVVVSITASIVVLTALREELPEILRPKLPLLLWVTAFASCSTFGYWWFSRILDQSQAMAWTAVIVGAYMLASSRLDALEPGPSIAYAASVVLACALFAYAFGVPWFYAAVAIAVALAPVAFPFYIRGLRHLGRLALRLGEALLILVLTYTVIAAGLAGMAASVFIVLNLPWVFNTLLHPALAEILFVVLVTLSCAIPAILRVEDFNLRMRTGLLAMLSLVASGFLVLLLPSMEIVLTSLVGAASFTLIIAAFSPRIPEIRNSRHPLVVGLVLLMVIVLYVTPLDFLLEILIAASWTAAVMGLVVEKRTALRFLYPVATAGAVGIFSLYGLLPYTDSISTVVFFAMLESLILCIPDDLYHPFTWSAFSFSTGYFAYSLLASFSQAAVFVAIGIVAELIGHTPKMEPEPVRHSILMGATRATWIGLSVVVQLTPILGRVIGIELAVVASLSVLRVSLTKTTRGVFVICQDLIGIATSILIYTWLSPWWPASIALHLSLIPIFLVAAVHSRSDPLRSIHEIVVLALVALYSVTLWTLFYPVLEVVPLSVTSGITMIALLRWIKSQDDRGSLLIPISAVILFVEVAWIWHAFFVFSFNLVTITLGGSLLLFSTLLLPATGSMEWARFEFVWESVSALNAFLLGAVLSGWNPFQLTSPPQPLLALGWMLSLYGLISASIIHYAESTLRGLQRIAHLSWIPSMPGWFLVVWEYGAVLSDIHLRLGVSTVAFSCALTPFLFIHPQRTELYPLVADVCFASSLAYVTWAFGAGFSNEFIRMVATLTVWYIVAFPITVSATISAFNRAKEFAAAHKTELVFTTPPMGAVAAFTLLRALLRAIGPDAQVRHLLISFTGTLFLFGFLYYVGSLLLEDTHRPSALGLSLLGVAGAAFTGPLYLLFPGLDAGTTALLFALSASFAVALLVSSGLSRAFHIDRATHPSHIIGGLSAGVATFLGLSTILSMAVLESLLAGVFVIFLIEAPFLTEQIRAFMRLLANLGSLMMAALRRLNAFLRYVFDRFGYILWVVFSSLVTVVIGTLTYPFFSELVGMQTGTLLFLIPSYSIPLALFGLLLVSIAAIRRGVQSSFGMSSIGVFITGSTLTAVSFLIDRGLLLPAVSATWAMVFLSLTIFASHLDQEDVRLRNMFATVPIAVAVFILSFFYQPTMSTNLLAVSIGLSLIVCFGIYIASARVGLTSESLLRPLEVGIASTSALITYAVADLAFLPLACTYLSAFVFSWLVLPLARREHIHLFNAPLFFSLTGFGFTFVFGELIQGLLLATAACLLFVSLYIREREAENPQLVYARLVALLVLIASLAGFAILTLMPSLL